MQLFCAHNNFFAQSVVQINLIYHAALLWTNTPVSLTFSPSCILIAQGELLLGGVRPNNQLPITKHFYLIQSILLSENKNLVFLAPPGTSV